MRKYKLSWLLLLIACVTVNALSQANRLQDLVNGRASSGESQIESRGYIFIHGSKSGSDSYGYWWNPSSKKCVSVRTNDGRYASIVDTLPADCHQRAAANNNGNKAAVGGAVAAGAIIGAIILAHKAHHHDNDKHYDNDNHEAEYERGFRDGLHNSSYHNYSNTDYYKRGYESGVEQRREETRHNSGYGGYTPYAQYNDLVGERASSGESQLESRGFRNVDGFKSGSTSYTIWWNGRTRQCLQVATADGRYDSIVDIQSHPRCR